MGDESMKEYWVMKVAFRDGTKYQGITRCSLDIREGRKRLLRDFHKIFPVAEVRRKGGGIMKILIGKEKEKNELQRTDSTESRNYTSNRKQRIVDNPKGIREEITKACKTKKQKSRA